MKKLTFLLMATLAASSASLQAQVQLKSADVNVGEPVNTHQSSPTTQFTDSMALVAGKDYTSGWALTSDADKTVWGRYLLQNGHEPAMTRLENDVRKAPRKDPYGPEDDTVYKYSGFNTAAGLAADGTTQTGGMVNFNITGVNYGAETGWKYEKGEDVFETDTVSSAPYLSPYSYMAGGKLYCILPVTTQHWTGATIFNSLTVTTYDALTFEQLEQQVVDIPGQKKSYAPWVLSYDSQYNKVYAISFSDASEEDDKQEHYYLNIMDTDTWQMKRLARIDEINGERVVPRGLCCSSGTIFVNYTFDEKVWLARFDLTKMQLTKIAPMDGVQGKYTIGQQPMIYDTKVYKILYNHYDMEHAGQFFYVNTYAPSTWDPELGMSVATGDIETINLVNTTEHITYGTSYSMFYERPTQTGTSTELKDWQTIDDFELSINNETEEITVKFTLPEAKYADGTDFEFESYNYKKVTANFTTSNIGPIYPSGYWSNLDYGTVVEKTFQVNPGLHFISIKVTPGDYNISQTVNPIVLSKTIFVGYDAPEAPLKPSLVITDSQNAKITWQAPQKSRFADFNTEYGAEEMTYTVVNNVTGDTIAADITTLEASEVIESEVLTAYTYSIYATAKGKTSLPATTPLQMGGKYATMPYVNNFENESMLNGWEIIDVNTPGTLLKWGYNNYYHYVTGAYNRENDDWLITPPMLFEAGKLYMLRTTVEGCGDLYITYGQGNTPEQQTNEIDHITATSVYGHGINNTIRNQETHYYYVRPENDGLYYFGFHDFNNRAEGNGWTIYDVSVDKVAEPLAPANVSDLAFTPAPKGELSGTLSFNLPTTDIEGNTIESLTNVAVYDNDGNLLAQNEEVSTGANVSLDVQATWGWNQYKVVAANEQGEGYPVHIRKFVGPDKPKAPQNLQATWGEEWNELLLTWDPVDAEGENGGYVDPEAVSYHVYKYQGSWPPYTLLGETGTETSVEVEILDATEKQNQYILAVDAINDVVRDFEYYNRNLSRVGIVLGKPQPLPFTEPFNADALVGDVYINKTGINGQQWAVDAGYYNTNILPQNGGAQIVFVNNNTGEGSGSFVSPILDFTETSHPMFRLWLNHAPNMPEGAYVAIEATTDGCNFETITEQQTLTGNAGWVEHVFDLSKVAGKKAQIGVVGYLPNPANHIFMDNWNISEGTGKDLAAAAISVPQNPVVGKTETIEVTVANMGAEPAADYSVMFTLNDEIIDEQFAEETLESGKSATFVFQLPVNMSQEEIIYSAEVLFDGDENEDNNLTTEVELTPTQYDLPAPANLQRANGGITWEAPEALDGYETVLDFETLPAFLTDNIAGWNTADLDENLTMSFIQYYGNTWPYMNEKLAWMTWSNTEAGAGVLAAKSTHGTPYGDKCLIAWGNYGVDADGRTSTKADDDWFISPEVKAGTEFAFDVCLNWADCTIEVLTSSTDREPASFTNVLKSVTGTGTMGQWTNQSVTLPEDAKYVAIHVTQNGFDILVDNISYTAALAPQLLGYNVYVNGVLDSFVETTSAPAVYSQVAVSAVYDLGESALSNLLEATGIEEIDNTKLSSDKYYDLSGREISTKKHGVNIVRQANGKTVKVIIK